MYCIKCGKELNSTDRFCVGCGTPNPQFNAAAPTQPLQNAVPTQPAQPYQPVQQTPAYQTQPVYPPVQQIPAKKSGNGVLVGIVCGVVALLLAIGAALFFLTRPNAEKKALKALEDGDYSTAAELIDKNEKLKDSAKIKTVLLERIAQIEEDFADGDITAKSAERELKQIKKLGVSGIKKVAEEVLALLEIAGDPKDTDEELSTELPEDTKPAATEAVIDTMAPETEAPETEAAPAVYDEVFHVALITDVGQVDDGSYNEAAWRGIQSFCYEYSVDCTYYKPVDDTTDSRIEAAEMAIWDGYDVLVMPGWTFGPVIAEMQDEYPNVKFIGIDITDGDLTTDYYDYEEPSLNTAVFSYQEDQAGYLAGYAAVADGYTELGFLGGMEVSAVTRYGYGFVQGANAAAEEYGADVHVKFGYGGQFFGDSNITSKMKKWYQKGTEVIFACGGGIYTSVCEAAADCGGKVIGVDVDQYEMISAYDEDIYLTSAMKNMDITVYSALYYNYMGLWDYIGGYFNCLSLSSGDYVGLSREHWCFDTFSTDEYDRIVEELSNGGRVCSSDTDSEPYVSIDVDYLGNIY